MSDQVLARLDSIDEKVTSTKEGVERLEGEVFHGREGREPIIARLAAIEKNGEDAKKSISPKPEPKKNGRKVELALIGLLMAIVAAISAFATKAIE